MAAAIFILGAAAGGAVVALVGVRLVKQSIQNPANAPGFADRAADRIGADLAKSLQLTADESARVQAILDKTALNLKGVRVQATAQAVAEFRSATEQIAKELPLRKRLEFYRVIARRYERLGLVPPRAERNP